MLDLEYLLNLPINDSNKLCAELTKTTKKEILIFVRENLLFNQNRTKLKKVVEAVHDKMKIIVTNRMSAEKIKEYLPPTVDLNIKINLTCMTEESTKTLLKR